MPKKKEIDHLQIGVQIAPNDPFWVQVSENIRQELTNQIVPFEIVQHGANLSDEQMDELSEEILSSDLDAFICMILPLRIINRLLNQGIPVICVEDEIEISHPLFSSVRGWYDAGKMAAQFLFDSLRGEGQVLCLKGNVDSTDNLDFSRQRMAGINRVLKEYPQIKMQVVQSYWDYSAAAEHLAGLFRTGEIIRPDAILGLSDSLALAARDAGRASRIVADATFIAGINGEPAALSEILKGSIQATVDIRAEEFAGQAVKIAVDSIHGKALPKHFYFSPELVTSQNVADVSVRKLSAISSIPTRLVGVNRKTEESRLLQYEITSSINRKMAVLSDKKELIDSITELIRINYAYDRVFFYSSQDDKNLPDQNLGNNTLLQTQQSACETSLLDEVYERGEAIFVADMRFSNRFSANDNQSGTRSRVVLPVRFGDKVFGILDLQSDLPKTRLGNELMGLQSLADQLGIALHNAQLYEEAVRSRAAAEKANQLKTRLLANVSHELRAPLNVILGYSQAALANPLMYQTELPEELLRDIGHIVNSGEHLIRLINDLLDVSRAEIGALDIFPEILSPAPILKDIFAALAEQPAGDQGVEWRLAFADTLPLIKADEIRLRQILINLLSNAKKFTETGSITLGADIQPPYLHFWVKDTGRGISDDVRKRIFEPFATANSAKKRFEGIGLGLNITRRLVLLHHGKLLVESIVGQGSTFHVFLPLPSLSDEMLLVEARSAERQAILVISAADSPSGVIVDICNKRSLACCSLNPGQDLESVLLHFDPVAIAWDASISDPGIWIQLEQVREHPQLNKIPFLIYQADGENSKTPIGAVNVITKPVQNSTLYEYVLTLQPENSTRPILIVDDDADTRGMYKKMLKEYFSEFGIVEAENGFQALDLLKKSLPSLIILDLVMPGMDGFEVLETIRASKKTCHIPVVVMSGKTLTLDDVRRLDYSNVIFQRKNLLTIEETLLCLKKVFGNDEKLPQPTSLLVKQALAYIHQKYQEPISREDVANAVGTSPSYLSRIFSQEIGITLWECLVRLRMQTAKDLLLDSRDTKSVTEIASSVGFDDPSYFCKVFKNYAGISPVLFRKQSQKF
jgi:signal transduction histidine kinase/ABC-type sugar transport system substrate-binding protein/AraC-like DNA-binding protein